MHTGIPVRSYYRGEGTRFLNRNFMKVILYSTKWIEKKNEYKICVILFIEVFVGKQNQNK